MQNLGKIKQMQMDIYRHFELDEDEVIEDQDFEHSEQKEVVEVSPAQPAKSDYNGSPDGMNSMKCANGNCTKEVESIFNKEMLLINPLDSSHLSEPISKSDQS